MYNTLFRVLVVLVLLSSMSATGRAAEPDKPSDLEKRIAALEGNVKSIQSVVNDIQSKVNDDDSRNGELFESIALTSTFALFC